MKQTQKSTSKISVTKSFLSANIRECLCVGTLTKKRREDRTMQEDQQPGPSQMSTLTHKSHTELRQIWKHISSSPDIFHPFSAAVCAEWGAGQAGSVCMFSYQAARHISLSNLTRCSLICFGKNDKLGARWEKALKMRRLPRKSGVLAGMHLLVYERLMTVDSQLIVSSSTELERQLA